jgi:hypothetical protein
MAQVKPMISKQWHDHNGSWVRTYAVYMRRRWMPRREAYSMAVGRLCLYKSCGFTFNTLGRDIVEAATNQSRS